MARRYALCAVLVLTGVFGAAVRPAFTSAADAEVGGACTEMEFNEALAVVLGSGGGTISFDCPAGTVIVITGQKTITADTIIDGGGLVTLDANLQHRHFLVESGISLELRGLTLREGGGIPVIPDSPFTSGGAIYNDGGALTLFESTVISSGTELVLFGGAIYNNAGSVTIERSTLAHNDFAGNGGGIYNAQGNVKVISSTLSSNEERPHEGGRGPAIYNDGGQVEIVGSTIWNNSADDDRGLFSVSGGTVSFRATVIGRSRVHCGGSAFTSLGYNFDTDEEEPAPGFCNLTEPTDRVGVDVAHGGLLNNGGPTPTHLPTLPSPLVDFIPLEDCPTDALGNILPDQRGIPRPQGERCDIGAVEFIHDPLILDATAEPTSDPGTFLVSVNALPPDSGDPLTYEFDCNGDGLFETSSGAANSAECVVDPTTFSPEIGVRVNDTDGSTTTTIILETELTLCRDANTGLLFAAQQTGCSGRQSEITLSGESSTVLCVNFISGLLRAPSAACPRGWVELSVPGAEPFPTCRSPLSGLLRLPPSGRCAWYEIPGILPAV